MMVASRAQSSYICLCLFTIPSLSLECKDVQLKKHIGRLQCDIATAAAKSLQSCPTLCNPIEGSPLGCAIPEILQARTLEWVAIFFSNERK